MENENENKNLDVNELDQVAGGMASDYPDGSMMTFCPNCQRYFPSTIEQIMTAHYLECPHCGFRQIHEPPRNPLERWKQS